MPKVQRLNSVMRRNLGLSKSDARGMHVLSESQINKAPVAKEVYTYRDKSGFVRFILDNDSVKKIIKVFRKA